MKTGGLLLLSSLILLSGLSHCGNRFNDAENRQQQSPKPFRAGFEYTFTYNGQIASGLASTSVSDSESEQKAATRIQAQAKIAFGSERQATLRLEQPRIGQLNKRIDEPQKVQPMAMFESKHIEEENRRQLQLPIQFTYVDGVVERIQFHPQDSTWSKNVKRAVLNLIQLNLNRNNAQGLQSPEELNSGETQQQDEQADSDRQQKLTKAFTLPETTIEGQCQTTYTINNNAQTGQQNQDQDDSSSSEDADEEKNGRQARNTFNVTKSINFKQCKRIADVGFGFQTQQPQPEAALCQQQWYKQQQRSQQSGQQQQDQLPNPCKQYDPKEIKEQKLDRTTVFRYVLAGKPEKYSIQRAELISQYVFKSLRTESSSQHGATMHTIVAAELVFRSAQQTSLQQQQKYQSASGSEESLLYDNQWDVDEKRFYMYGDEEFLRNSPFKSVPNKHVEAHTILRKLAQSSVDTQKGIESDQVVELQRLVELLRMCSVEELKQVQNKLSRGQSNSDAEQKKIEQIFADSLAIAGTRNTIFVLVERIINHELSAANAVQALQSLSGLPAPSQQSVDIVLRLAKNEAAHRSPALKQASWLTFGSMVGELCQHMTQKNAQQSVFGAQSGFTTEEVCPQQKKEDYKKALLEQYQNAKSIYEKVLAMKSIGNAGLDICVNSLEQIIQDNSESKVVRVQAIDALRRLRTQMPRKIQRVLLPVFQNTREHPQVRMAAFSMLMNTIPEQPIVDQIAYTLSKERSQHVQAFVYTTMKSLARSKIPSQQELARHLKNALKVANVDEQSLPSSGKYQVPIYSDSQREGLFLNLVSVFSSRGMLPAHLSAGIDSLLNGEYEMNNIKIGFTQQELDGLYEHVMRKMVNVGQYSPSTKTRGQRTSENRGEQELREIFSGLKIKSRRGYRSQENEDQQSNEPFAMICARIGDVDQFILPIDQQTLPVLKQMINGDKPSLSGINWKQLSEGKHFRLITALNLNEKSAKIPTSMGVPLRILQSLPVLATIDVNIKMNFDQGIKAQLSAHPSLGIAHVQKMEAWMWPLLSCGVESTRGIEINLPLQGEIQAGQEEGIKVIIKTPQGTKTRVFGLHTLPVTFTREFDPKTNMFQRDSKVKTIHNSKLEQLQRDVNTVVGEHTLGMPVHVGGHFHVPSDITSYKQVVQLLMATQNHLHVTFQPTADTPREIVLKATWKGFQKISGSNSGSHKPELNNFYAKFEQAYPEDYEDMQLESNSQRRDKLSEFLNKFQPSLMYKHELKLSAQTIGGRKQNKANMALEGACDPKFQYCKMFVNVERSPMYPNENDDWTLKAKIQTLAPNTVSSIQQLHELEQKNKRFVAHAETAWGTDRKQSIILRIQGEQAQNQQWRQQIEDESQPEQNKYWKKRTAFLNKYDAAVEYKLQPYMQNAFTRGFELLKAHNFWNTQSQLQASERDGQIFATVVIDPISQKYANVSIKTPSQAVKIQSVDLTRSIRPFPLIRRQDNDKATHSVSQLLNRLSYSSRAECTADGKRVETFDGVLYKAPISTCYSVLAKDCTNENQPQFVVMMKSLDKNGQDKKLKVITPEQTIECQPKEKQLRCKVNGKVINYEQDSNEESNSGVVEYNNDEQTDVTINVNGVSVRLGCWYSGCKSQKVWIKISEEYKNGQCGLCGHYDDQPEDEWRMNNNELTNDLSEFHRSFSLQNNEECSADEQKKFYSKKEKFAPTYDDASYDDNSQNNSEENKADREWHENTYGEEDENNNDWSFSQGQKRSKNVKQGRKQQKTQEPVQQTKVIEFNHKICFSVQPVNQCPEGTVPASSSSTQRRDSNESDDDDQSGNTKVKMQFACLSRSSAEARRLQRQARRGVIVEIPDQTPNFVESVSQPQRCVQY